MQNHLSLLGHKVEDLITGLKGTVTSISFDISGCVQGLVNPGVDKDGKQRDSMWFDTKRLKSIAMPIVELPDFVIVPGPECKPPFIGQTIK